MKKFTIAAILFVATFLSALSACASNQIESFNKAIDLEANGNKKEAISILSRLAEDGYPPAQNSLGLHYENGDGVDMDYKKAAEWYAQAVIQDNPYAQYNYGRLLILGRGVEINPKAAISNFRKAAEQDLFQAQLTLAKVYSDTDYEEANMVEAYIWAKIAMLKDASEASKILDAVRTKLTQVQIQDADQAYQYRLKEISKASEVSASSKSQKSEPGFWEKLFELNRQIRANKSNVTCTTIGNTTNCR